MMNPFEEKPKSIKNYPMDWKTLYAAPAATAAAVLLR